MEQEVFIGIDVSKDRLDVADLSTGEVFWVDNTVPGLQELMRRLVEMRPTLVVCEASGGYEVDLVVASQESNLPLVVANPKQVRDFAKATGRLAKTDRLDALVIARYAQAIRPELRPLPDAKARQLAELVARRSQLIELLATEKQRSHQTRNLRAPQSIEQTIAFLEQQSKQISQAIHTLIQSHQPWARKNFLVQSVKGIGDSIAAVLLADLPELGRLSSKQIAALVGLAPFNFDSGQMRGTRHIFGGRVSVRCALFQAARVASQHNPYIKHLYIRLLDNGKPPKLALIACARHLLVMLNAMCRDDKPWNPPPFLTSS